MDSVIITAAGTALATTVITKGVESPIASFNNLWDGIIGHRIAAWSENKKLVAFQNVEKFKQELVNELNYIPSEYIKEPQLSIVGPALEASKYYFEEEDLRHMFAKLIASSMDSRQNGYVQHSFVEIIKQLTPLDANFIKSYTSSLPIVNLKLKNQKNQTYTVFSDFYIDNHFSDRMTNAISLNNLSRLGLFTVMYDTWLTNESLYAYVTNSPEYSQLKVMSSQSKMNDEPKEPQIQKGIIDITNFGVAFKKVCID